MRKRRARLVQENVNRPVGKEKLEAEKERENEVGHKFRRRKKKITN